MSRRPSRMPRCSARAVALPVVLLALALVSALVVGGAFVTREILASSRFEEGADQLGPAAEYALASAVAVWDTVGRAAQAVGEVEPLAGHASSPVSVDAWVTRLSPWTYWLVAEAAIGSRPRLTRRLGLIVRVQDGVPALVPERAWGELP